MKYNFILPSAILVGVLAIVPSVQADHSDDQYSFVANVVSMERTSTKPIPTEITWVESEAAEDGDVILDHFEVVLEENDIEVDRVTVAATDRSVILSKTNIPDMKVFTTYEVHVDEHYTDAAIEEGFDKTFYTAPPKIKNLRVKNKQLETDGDMSILVKWRQPTNLRGEYLYYDYKITRVNKPSKLVEEDSSWGDINSIAVDNLPAQSLQVRVRARSNTYGSGQWSSWKKFGAPTD